MLSAEANFRQLKPCLIAFNKEDVGEELLTGLHLQKGRYAPILAHLCTFTERFGLNAMPVLLNSSFRFVDIGFSLGNFEV